MGTDAIVVGAGPVGLMLAGELRLAGVDVVVCEMRDTASGESRGVGFTRRAAELFDQRGLLGRLGEFEIGNAGHFGGVRMDWGILEDDHFGVRGVPQYRIEAMLAAWVGELGVPVLRGHRLVDLRQTADEVIAAFAAPDGTAELRAAYLVGCDGGRSTVRGLLGIDFPGYAATRSMYVADVVGAGIRPRVIGERVPGGMVMAIRLEEDVDRIIIHPDVLPPRDVSTVTFAEIADSWQRLTGQSLHGARARWVSAFTDATRQAAEYRRGRVFIAGDATHVHIPAGAQGLSLGIQDAVNLGWKLAATINGWAPPALLDTYHAERHPADAQVLENTRQQAALYLAGAEMEPLRQVMRELVTYPDVALHLAGKVSGLNVRYDMGAPGHPLLGLRLSPDRELDVAGGGRVRVARLLHPAHGVLIDVGDSAATHAVGGDRDPGGPAELAAGWADRIDTVTGTWAATDGRPATLGSVLVRPDGHIAWTSGDGGRLQDALERWFGLARVAATSSFSGPPGPPIVH